MPLRAEVDEDGATEVAVDLRDRLGVGDGARDGVVTHFVGQGALWAGMQELSKEDLAKAESAGFPIVLLILLFVFGSLAAAALPLALGFVSVLVTGALIFGLSQVMEMSVFVTNMASMIGIGVAVDYSLFIVARYREEIAAGRARRTRAASRWRPPGSPCCSAGSPWSSRWRGCGWSTTPRSARWRSARCSSSAWPCSPRRRCCRS